MSCERCGRSSFDEAQGSLLSKGARQQQPGRSASEAKERWIVELLVEVDEQRFTVEGSYNPSDVHKDSTTFD